MNVDGPAIVTWIPEQKIGLTFASGGEKRPFDSLRGAVKFVIEKLWSRRSNSRGHRVRLR